MNKCTFVVNNAHARMAFQQFLQSYNALFNEWAWAFLEVNKFDPGS